MREERGEGERESKRREGERVSRGGTMLEGRRLRGVETVERHAG